MAKRIQRSQIEIFNEEILDFMSAVEIKGTDWDRIKPVYRTELLGSHCMQIAQYVDRCLEDSGSSVFAGLIFPELSSTPEFGRKPNPTSTTAPCRWSGTMMSDLGMEIRAAMIDGSFSVTCLPSLRTDIKGRVELSRSGKWQLERKTRCLGAVFWISEGSVTRFRNGRF